MGMSLGAFALKSLQTPPLCMATLLHTDVAKATIQTIHFMVLMSERVFLKLTTAFLSLEASKSRSMKCAKRRARADQRGA